MMLKGLVVFPLRSKHAGGFVWRYEGQKYKGEYKEKLLKRKFSQFSLAGKKLKTVEIISKAARHVNGSYKGIRRALRWEMKSSGGFIWKWASKK